MRAIEHAMQESAADTRAKEFVLEDLSAVARFWDPLMAYLGWTRADDGIGAVVYENGRSAIIFTSGHRWDMVLNDAQRVSPFAHLVFDLQSVEELIALAASLRCQTGVEIVGPRTLMEGERWQWSVSFGDPNGLDIEVRCPMG